MLSGSPQPQPRWHRDGAQPPPFSSLRAGTAFSSPLAGTAFPLSLSLAGTAFAFPTIGWHSLPLPYDLESPRPSFSLLAQAPSLPLSMAIRNPGPARRDSESLRSPREHRTALPGVPGALPSSTRAAAALPPRPWWASTWGGDET